jgi:hypothetical protein
MITRRVFAKPMSLNYLDAKNWVYESIPWLNEHVGCTIAEAIGAHNSVAGARPNPEDVPCWNHLHHMFSSVIDDEDDAQLYMEWFHGEGWQIFIIEKQMNKRQYDAYVRIDDPIAAVHFKLACT